MQGVGALRKFLAGCVLIQALLSTTQLEFFLSHILPTATSIPDSFIPHQFHSLFASPQIRLLSSYTYPNRSGLLSLTKSFLICPLRNMKLVEALPVGFV